MAFTPFLFGTPKDLWEEPREALLALFKLWPTPLKILCRDENLLGAKTVVIARIHGRIHCQEHGHCTVLSV
jgi:hypothetical protein